MLTWGLLGLLVLALVMAGLFGLAWMVLHE